MAAELESPKQVGGFLQPCVQILGDVLAKQRPCCSLLVPLGPATLPSAQPGPGDPQVGEGGCGLAGCVPAGRPACVAPGRRLPPSLPPR